MERQSGQGSEQSTQEATLFVGSLAAPLKKPDERQLLQLLCQSDPDIRQRAWDALCPFASEYSLLAARTAISDENEFVRNTGMEIIGEIGNAQDLRRGVYGLQDESWVVPDQTQTSRMPEVWAVGFRYLRSTQRSAGTVKPADYCSL